MTDSPLHDEHEDSAEKLLQKEDDESKALAPNTTATSRPYKEKTKEKSVRKAGNKPLKYSTDKHATQTKDKNSKEKTLKPSPEKLKAGAAVEKAKITLEKGKTTKANGAKKEAEPAVTSPQQQDGEESVDEELELDLKAHGK